jgi:ribosomal protein S17E
MEDLMLFQDTLRGSIITDDTPSWYPTDTSRVSMEIIRNTVAEHMKSENPQIKVVLDLLGISGKVFMTAITCNQMSEASLAKWTSYLLSEFQRDLEENKLAFREMMRKYDISKTSFYNLKGYFVHVLRQNQSGVLVSINPEQQAQARVVAKRLIAEGQENKQIVDAVFNETRVKYTTSAISKLRSRNSDLG